MAYVSGPLSPLTYLILTTSLIGDTRHRISLTLRHTFSPPFNISEIGCRFTVTVSPVAASAAGGKALHAHLLVRPRKHRSLFNAGSIVETRHQRFKCAAT